MKVAKYESSLGALKAYLDAKPQSALIADLYTFNLASTVNAGAPLLYTTCDIDVKVPYGSPITYSSKSVYFDQLGNKAVGHWKVGLDVDTWQVQTTPTPQATINGQAWLSALRGGALDGAIVAVDRAFFDIRSGTLQGQPPISPLGVVNIFTGRVAEIDLGRSNAVISINSHLELLDVGMPQNLYQAGCRWTLFSAGCTLSAASFGIGGTIASPTSSNTISVNLAAPGGSGTYALGRITMTSGNNNGFSRTVRSWTAGSPASMTLIAPFPYALAASDTFTAFPGCDKSQTSCSAFANTANFGGEPLIPAPEAAS